MVPKYVLANHVMWLTQSKYRVEWAVLGDFRKIEKSEY